MEDRELRLRARIDTLADRVEVLNDRVEKLELALADARSRRAYWASRTGGLKASREFWKQRARAAERMLWVSNQRRRLYAAATTANMAAALDPALSVRPLGRDPELRLNEKAPPPPKGRGAPRE